MLHSYCTHNYATYGQKSQYDWHIHVINKRRIGAALQVFGFRCKQRNDHWAELNGVEVVPAVATFVAVDAVGGIDVIGILETAVLAEMMVLV